MNRLPSRIVPLLGVAALLGSAPYSSAFLIVSEGFDYAVGPLTGNNGGTGFSGAWTTEDGETPLNIAAGTFTDPLLLSAGSGNQAIIDSSAGSQISTRPFDTPTGLGDDGSELWYSFLFQDGGSPSSSSDFSLFDTGTSGPITLRLTTSAKRIRFGGTTLDEIETEIGSEVNLFVGRVTFSDTDGADTHTVWLNPTSTSGGTPTGGLMGGGAGDVGDISEGHLTLQGGTAWLGSYDEIRLGTTLNSVVLVPEPSMIAVLLGLGAGAFALMRRRRA